MDSLEELRDLWKNRSNLDESLGILQSERCAKEKRLHDRLASVLWDAGLEHVIIAVPNKERLAKHPLTYHIWMDESRIRILKSGDYPGGNRTNYSFSEAIAKYPELFRANVFRILIDTCLKEMKAENLKTIQSIEAERARITKAEGLARELEEVGL